MGECVMTYLSPALSKGEGERIDISLLPEGVYFVKIGNSFVKFVKEKEYLNKICRFVLIKIG